VDVHDERQVRQDILDERGELEIRRHFWYEISRVVIAQKLIDFVTAMRAKCSLNIAISPATKRDADMICKVMV